MQVDNISMSFPGLPVLSFNSFKTLLRSFSVHNLFARFGPFSFTSLMISVTVSANNFPSEALVHKDPDIRKLSQLTPQKHGRPDRRGLP